MPARPGRAGQAEWHVTDAAPPSSRYPSRARSESGTRPSRTARAATSVRLPAWSFSRMFLRWYFAVFSLIPSSAAISLLRSPRGHQPEDLDLALGQPVGVGRSAVGGPSRGDPLATEELVDDPGSRGRGDRRLAPADRLEHRPELGRLEVLQEVALGARLDRLEQVVLVLADGQDDDRDRRPGGLDPARSPRGPSHRHPDVHQDEVRLEPRRPGRRPRRRSTPVPRPRGPTPRAATRRRRGRAAWSSARRIRIRRRSPRPDRSPGWPDGRSCRAPGALRHCSSPPIVAARWRMAVRP